MISVLGAERLSLDEFERRAKLSNGHLYNLRHSSRYGLCLRHLEKTRPAAVQIGERKGPLPTASPAFCASTPCTGATAQRARESITSTPSMSSPSGRWC
jgi:hypothetical protein